MSEEDPAQVANEFEDDERFDSMKLSWGLIFLGIFSSLVAVNVFFFVDRVVLSDEVYVEIRMVGAVFAALVAWATVFWGLPWADRWVKKP